MADLLKHAPHIVTYVLPCRIWSFCVKGCRPFITGEPQNGELWNSTLLGWEAWLTPRYTRLPTSYHVKLGSSATRGVQINRTEPRNWGALKTLGAGAWLTLKNKPPSHVCFYVTFGTSAIKGFRINRKEPQNWGALGPRPLGVGSG